MMPITYWWRGRMSAGSARGIRMMPTGMRGGCSCPMAARFILMHGDSVEKTGTGSERCIIFLFEMRGRII